MTGSNTKGWPVTARRENPYFGWFACRGALLLTMVGMLVQSMGCGGGVPPEQKAAMARIAELGGRVNFKRGGYEVDLTKTPVENKDLAQLKQIPNLKNIDLQGTRVGDEGIEHLQSIDTLELVYLQRTVVTPEGAERLRKSLPNAEVSR
jgi:hypothetical protein